ncbi:cytochrome b [Sphingosinicella sp. BN140058]|nr:cytochrome b [Sphingosinicella sp. BN140058]
MAGQETARYTRVAILLHWTIAALILANLFLGFFHESFGRGATSWMMWFHKSLGMTVLGLTVLRLIWRLSHRPPAYDAVMKRWEAGLAAVIHWLFYVALIAIPLSGWLLSSSGGRVTSFFGLFDIAPLPIARRDDIRDMFEEAHELLAWSMIVLLTLHVAGALKHHLDGHRHLIGRMVPFLYRR